MKKMSLALAAAAICLLANEASAQQAGPWLVRARAEHLAPANRSDPISGAGARDRLTVSDKTIPELDISYFFTPNFALELVANHWGWSIGAGIEHAVTDQFRVRLDYLYTQFDDASYKTACCTIDGGPGDEQEVRFAAIWAF